MQQVINVHVFVEINVSPLIAFPFMHTCVGVYMHGAFIQPLSVSLLPQRRSYNGMNLHFFLYTHFLIHTSTQLPVPLSRLYIFLSLIISTAICCLSVLPFFSFFLFLSSYMYVYPSIYSFIYVYFYLSILYLPPCAVSSASLLSLNSHIF